MTWAAYLQKRERDRRGVDIPPGWVPSTFLVADDGGELVGRVSIRHELNEFLASLGGHIGYGVRPAFRRRGYASEILRQALVIARSLGIEGVLVTCDEDNVASRAVIERLGGMLEDVRPDPEGAPKRRYWFR
jgi:predicted acetyltransferase